MRKEKDANAESEIAALILAFNKAMDSGGYPTPEEIMSAQVEFDMQTLRTVEAWKHEVWYPVREASEEHRFLAIAALLERLAGDLGKPLTKTVWETDGKSKLGSHYSNGTIVLCGRPSVITALHELGHHLLGDSELDACAWSVHLFRLTFPKAFMSLSWNGHMLSRATERQKEETETAQQGSYESLAA